MQKAKAENKEISVCLVEKGSEIGAHILSGAVVDQVAVAELFPDWEAMGTPLHTKVNQDELHWLSSASESRHLSHWMMPKSIHNDDNYITSLRNHCRWLAKPAAG